MTPIIPPINPGDSGAAVANLHDALRFLLERNAIRANDTERPTAEDLRELAEKLKAERKDEVFGDATRRIVFWLQLQNGLGDTFNGAVEQQTADLLNRLLREFGAPFEPGGGSGTPDTRYIVRCRAVDGSEEPIAGLRIELFDQDPARSPHDPLGDPAITDARGLATFRFRRSDFSEHPGERGPDLFFALSGDGVPLDYTLPGIPNDKGVIRNFRPQNAIIELRIEHHVVHGRVTDDTGRARAGLKVVALDRDLFESDFIGDAVTDAEGRYRIVYRLEQVAGGEGRPGTAADLEVRVLPSEGAEPLAISPVRFNAKRVETIDLVVPEREIGPVEFDDVMQRVMPMLGDRSPLVLGEDHIGFIVGDTGLPIEAVRAWVGGARMARDLAVQTSDQASLHADALRSFGWSVFYGFVRCQQARDIDEVLVCDEAQWRAWHAHNAEGGWVAPVSDEIWSRITQDLDRLRQRRRIDPLRNPQHPLARAIRLVALDPPPGWLDRVAALFDAEPELRPDTLYALAPDGIEGASADAVATRALVRGLRLVQFTDGDLDLGAVIGSAIPNDGPRSHELDALAVATQDEWKGWCKAAGRDPVEADAALPWSLQARAESLYPLKALNARLQQGMLALTDDEAEGLRAAAEAAPRAVEALLSGVLGDETDAFPEDTKALVRDLGRHLKVGFTLEAGAALRANGIATPGAASSLGVEVVQAALGEAVAKPYVTAVMQHLGTIVASSGAFYNAVVGAHAAPLGMQPLSQPVSAAAQQAFPNLASIFGDMGECACRPCDSVLGLPAYLADLLGFLKRIPAHSLSANNALMALRARRPDITRLPLDCPNAETEIPHIDLVIEALEGIVGTNPEAKLALARFPWTLPFSRQNVELDAWLRLAGVSREAWLGTMLGRAGNAQHAQALAGQRLGLGPDAWQTVAMPATTDNKVWRAFGFSGAAAVDIPDPASGRTVRGTPLQLLGRVSVLLDRTGLDLADLRMALGTDFVKGRATISIAGLEGCKTSEMSVSGLDRSILDRLHRFVRLWRAVSTAPIPVLDSALSACTQTSPAGFATVLVRLSALLALAKRLDLGLEVLLSLFRPLDQIRVPAGNGVTQTLYSSLFRSSALPAAQRSTFPDVPTAANAFAFGPISTRFGAIAEAIGCQPAALARWVHVSGSAGVASPVAYLLADAWTYDALTALYRRQTLGAALSLGPAELMLMTRMTGSNVIASGSAEAFAAAMTTLLDALDVQRRSRIGIEDTARMLLPDSDRGGVPRPNSGGPDWGAIKSGLVTLRRALRDLRHRLVPISASEEDLEPVIDDLIDKIRPWVSDAGVRLLARALREGLPVDPAERAVLTGALATPVAGLTGPDGRGVLFLIPTRTTQLLGAPAKPDRVQALHDRVRELSRRLVLRETLADWSGLPTALIDTLVARDLPVELPGRGPQSAEDEFLSVASGGFLDAAMTDEQAAGGGPLVEWMYRLQRWAWLMNTLQVADPVALLTALRQTSLLTMSGPASFSLSRLLAPTDRDGGRLRWAEWRSMLATAWLLHENALDPAWSVPLMRDLHAAGAMVRAATWEPLARAWTLTADETHLLLGSLTPSVFENCDPWHWWRARALVADLQALGLGVSAWLSLCNSSVDPAMVNTARAFAKSVRPARVSQTTDRLKTAWRDALLDNATQVMGKSRQALYAHHLIDLEMAPCMMTTRLLQAVASVQQFVHRILFGLEPGIGARQGADLSRIRQEWEWMSQYRVWEANRKVFLFPENWLLPELRDDKSECFRSLEAALSGPDITQSEAEQAYGRFIDDVALAGRIVVLGMCEDVPQGSMTIRHDTPRDLYLVGRTQHQPYRYFWRVARGFGRPTAEWTPWQLIDVDVQGDHIVPFVLHGDLHVAWPNFERSAGSGDKSAVQLKMSWSRLVGRRWHGVEVTRDALPVSTPPTDDERSGFAFRAEQGDGVARVIGYARDTGESLAGAAPQPDRGEGPEEELASSTSQQLSAILGSAYMNSVCVVVGQDAGVTQFTFRPNLQPGENVGAVMFVEPTVWVHVTGPSGRPGFVRLAPGRQYDLRLQFRSGTHVVSAEARRAAIWVTDYESPQIPALQLAAELVLGSRTFPSAEMSFGSTGAGSKRTVRPILVITPSTPISLAELGIASSENFTSVAEFECTAGNARLRPASIKRTLARLPLCSAAMGGYRGNRDTSPISLPSPSAAPGSLTPFRQPYWLGEGYWDKDGELWLVGAASNRSDTSNPPVWYYFDGHDACLIDLMPGGTGSTRFSLVASAFHEAATFRGELARGLPALADRGREPISFSAADLPAPEAAGASPEWQAQVAGERGFDLSLPFAPYSWEVFFHAPLLIADRLGKQGRYADAERWLRMLLDPTHGTSSWDPKAFLRFRPFRDVDASDGVRATMEALAQAKQGLGSPAGGAAVAALVDRWREQAFMPFTIARGRPIAFLWRTVFAYLDNLLAWADDLYRIDTRESINEALQLYVLASQILGRRPTLAKGQQSHPSKTYDEIETLWDDFANAWIDTSTPLGNAPPGPRLPRDQAVPQLPGVPIVGALYFCIPANPKVLQYWTLLEARLLNIRHCRNIDGIARTLPLLEAPIDVELLVRAVAAGLDIGEVVRGLYAPPHPYRAQVLAARALDLANEARSLSAAMLSALEKRDAEKLAELRSSNEIALLQRMKDIRTRQRDEAEEVLRGLEVSRDAAERRFRHLQKLLGKNAEPPTRNQTLSDEPMLTGPVSRAGTGLAAQFGSSLGLIEAELAHAEQIGVSHQLMIAAGIAKGVGSVFHLAEAVAEAFEQKSKGAMLRAFGVATGAVGDALDVASRGHQNVANLESARASYLRRRDEWAHQSNQVLGELRSIDRQILAQEIRRDIADRELRNHEAQIVESQQVDAFLRDKFSNAELFDWMQGELLSLLKSTYRMALALARRTETAYSRELGTAPLGVIGNDHWNDRRSGLLAAERLVHELKKLELNVLEQHRRELEVTRHISLKRLDPSALYGLITTGSCEFEVPEWLFDLDAPGHYLRRMKSVSVSIPCVSGPYTSINAKLTLLRSDTRVSPLGQDYVRDPDDDDRFDTRYHGSESIFVSSGRDDSGLFETNLRDERYLPFEGAGAVARWRIDFPSKVPQFDRTTISDVVLHLRYSARDGGADLAVAARTALSARLQAVPNDLFVGLSLRTEFATEWAAALAAGADPVMLRVRIDPAVVLPYWMQQAGVVLVEGQETVQVLSSPPVTVTKWNGTDLEIECSGSTPADIIVVLQAKMPQQPAT